MYIGGKPVPMSPPVDEPDGSPQSPFSRYGKFQSSVRAELTSYQFKVNNLSLHLVVRGLVSSHSHFLSYKYTR